jgi:hypothetical protein
MSKLPVGTIALTNPEAKLLLVSLRARCARLQSRLNQTKPELASAVKADLTRTSILLGKINKAFPESNFHAERPTTPPPVFREPYCPTERENEANWNLQEGNG